ncbi:MAG TPA: branched-chain amino acid ABC transporter permease [Kofleriaceae bacterium]|nr:branched-chain amino acid ABC transporter permease [Kofleriaceae bacterium]
MTAPGAPDRVPDRAPGRAPRWLRLAIAGGLVAVLVACPAWGGDSARSTLVVFAYYAALAQMWNLLAGYAGLVSFGQQLFIGLGGYTVAVGCERLGLGVWVAFGLAAVVTGALAVPVGALTFRLKGGYFAVGSWLVSELFRLGFGNTRTSTTPPACSCGRRAASIRG